MFPLALLLAIIFHWLCLFYDLLITRTRERENEAGNIHFRERNLILGYFAKASTYKMRRSTSVEHCDLPVITDQLTERNVRVFLLNVRQPTIDLELTLTTHLLKTSASNELPFGFPGCRVDVSAAVEAARVFDTLIAAVRAACRRHQRHLTTGKEIVLHRPRYFHGLTFDLTAAIEIARMHQSPSGGLTYIDYRRLAKISIPSEFFAGLGDLTPQVIADEISVADGDKQNRGSTTTVVSESELHPLTVTKLETPRACINVEKEENQVSLAFVYDEDLCQQSVDEPVRALVKWDGPNDVTDRNLDLGQGEGWKVSDMYAVNEADFGYKTTFDEAMSEYTTVLVRDNTPEYRRRWERACRLADEIEAYKETRTGQVG